MSVHCPICKHHIPLYRLRHRLVCRHCENPLEVHLAAPVLTFAFLCAAVNGFIALVWWTLSQPDPNKDNVPNPSGDWDRYPMFLIILGCFLTWGLFLWIFKTVTHVTLDRQRLPDGNPRQRTSSRHFQGGNTPMNPVK